MMEGGPRTVNFHTKFRGNRSDDLKSRIGLTGKHKDRKRYRFTQKRGRAGARARTHAQTIVVS